LIRAYSAGLGETSPWGVAPGLHELAPLALNRYPGWKPGGRVRQDA